MNDSARTRITIILKAPACVRKTKKAVMMRIQATTTLLSAPFCARLRARGFFQPRCKLVLLAVPSSSSACLDGSIAGRKPIDACRLVSEGDDRHREALAMLNAVAFHGDRWGGHLCCLLLTCARHGGVREGGVLGACANGCVLVPASASTGSAIPKACTGRRVPRSTSPWTRSSSM